MSGLDKIISNFHDHLTFETVDKNYEKYLYDENTEQMQTSTKFKRIKKNLKN